MTIQFPYPNYKYDLLFRLTNKTITKPDRCIEWTGAKTHRGYGQTTITLEKHKSKTALCHRLLWELTHDVKLSRHQYVCHKCDNPSCLNIDHLYLGTAKDNSEDMVRKGRSTKGRDIGHVCNVGKKYKIHTRKRLFTDEQILEIRSLHANNYRYQREIAKMFNVSASVINSIVNHKSWKHLP